jgi:uncharacterized coiled-coil protein SlyX
MTHESREDFRIELESKIAFQEKAIADLNEALVGNTRTILELQRRIELLENVVRRLNNRLESFDDLPPNETPPHY